ncbi:MAG: metallophosphoesterase [Caldisericum sp.]|jgi:hypothetical protein|nr:metallophosphoesterase [Caldisericum sp.]
MFVTISVVIVSLVLIYGIFIERLQVETTHISFGSNLGIKFAHITDLHFSRESIREKKVLEILKEGAPDVIFITGDIVNYRRNFVASNYLKKIVDLGKPVYFVLGNWDYKVRDVENLKNALKSLSIIVLENESIIFEKWDTKINIIGVSDPYTKRADLKKAMSNIDKTLYTILLAHSPDIFYEAVAQNIDLVLAGHLHGGQVRLPFLKFAIYSPSKYGSRFLYGIFRNNSTTMYVNRGIGESHFPIRIFSKPEVLIGEI